MFRKLCQPNFEKCVLIPTVPGIQHGWAGRHAVRIAVHHTRLCKPTRGTVRLSEPPLTVRAESLFAEPLRLSVSRVVATIGVVERRSVLAAAVLIAGQVEGALPPLGRRSSGIAVNERGGGAGGRPAARR